MRHGLVVLVLALMSLIPGVVKGENVVENLGVPSKIAEVYGSLVSPDGKTILCNFGQTVNDFFVVAVTTDGVAKKIVPPPGKGNQWVLCRGFIFNPVDRKVYIGSTFDATFFRLDPFNLDKGIELLGQMEKGETYSWNMTVGLDGKVYAGTYPGCKLFAYDPAAGKVLKLGKMSGNNKYCRTLAVGKNGKIYCGLGCDEQDVVVYNPVDGSTKSVIISGLKKPGFATVGNNADGEVYTNVNGKSYIIDDNDNLVEKKYSTARYTVHFPNTFADGSILLGVNLEGKYTIKDSSTGVKTTGKFEYSSDGVLVFALVEGPDKNIYGSTFLPLSIFKYDTKSGKNEFLGVHGGGEVYSFVTYKNKIIESVYPQGRIFSYDLDKPWNPNGDAAISPSTNPKTIVSLGSPFMRPMCTIIVDNMVYIAGITDYGYHQGGIAVIDAETEKLVAKYEGVISSQSVSVITYDPATKLIFGGSSIHIGNRKPIASAATMFAFNPVTGKVEYEFSPTTSTYTGVQFIATLKPGIVAIILSLDGKWQLFVYDTVKKEFIAKNIVTPLKKTPVRFYNTAKNGMVYSNTGRELYTINPQTYEVKVIKSVEEGNISTNAVLSGGYLYYGVDQMLYRYKVEGN
ncbi:MAG: hypothetical protein WC955_02070 [Elusimicrobiota bacterium]